MRISFRHAQIILIATVCGVVTGFATNTYWIVGITLFLAMLIPIFYNKYRCLLSPLLFFAIADFSALLYTPEIYSDNSDISTLTAVNSLFGETVTISGVVDESRTLTSGEHSIIDVYSIATPEHQFNCQNIRLSLYSSPEMVLNSGDIITTSGEIAMPKDSILFDSYPRLSFISAHEPVFTLFQLSVIPQVVGQSLSIRTWAVKVNNYLCRYVDNTILRPESKGLIKAIIFGEKNGLSYNQRSQFADAGLSHVLAVSGMHVGIICTIILFLTMPIHLVKGGFHLRYIVCTILIWVYVLITGLSYSAVRAAIMLTFVMSALVSGRNRSPFSAACYAVSLIIVCNPPSLCSVGLWLSFTCVSAIVLLIPRLNVIELADHPRTYKVFAFLTTTLIATGASWMISAYSFGTVPVDFLISNILVLPLLPFYVVMAACYLFIIAIMQLPPSAIRLLSEIVDYPPGLLFDFITHIRGNSMAVEVPTLSLILYYAGFMTLIYAMYISGHNVSRYYSPDSLSHPFQLTPAVPKTQRLYYFVAIMLIITSIVIIN